MVSPVQRLAVLVVLVAAAAAGAVHAQSEAPGPRLLVSFAFPDGSVESTSVVPAEVERLTGQRPAYMLLPWVEAALRKLELSYTSEPDSRGVRVTSIAGVANGSEGEWVYSADGNLSAYRLDTQTIEGVSRVAFSYRRLDP